jgi:hypothetical protein
MPKKPVAVSLRKPQPSADIDAFVTGQNTPPLAGAPTPARAAQSPVVQHGPREYRELTLYLPSDIARQLSFYCMDRNCDVNGVVAEAVTKLVVPSVADASAPAERLSFDRASLEALLQRSRRTLASLWALGRWAV